MKGLDFEDHQWGQTVPSPAESRRALWVGRWRITAVIFENSAPEGKYVILKIDKNGEAELVQADEYKRMRTYAII